MQTALFINYSISKPVCECLVINSLQCLTVLSSSDKTNAFPMQYFTVERNSYPTSEVAKYLLYFHIFSIQ